MTVSATYKDWKLNNPTADSLQTLATFDATYKTRAGDYLSSRFGGYGLLYADDVFDRILNAKLLGAESDFVRVGKTLAVMRSANADDFANLTTKTDANSTKNVGYAGYNASGTYQTDTNPTNSTTQTFTPIETAQAMQAMAAENLYSWLDGLVGDLFRTLY